MRIIVALVFVAFVQAQSPREQTISTLESNLARHPDNLGERQRLLQLYYDNPNTPIDRASRDARRRHVLWLVENHPDAPGLLTHFGELEPDGPKADPDGSAEVARRWRAAMATPDASAKVLANAAWFFKLSDRAEARALIDRAWRLDSSDRQVARARGMLDVLAWLGATRLRNDVIVEFDPALKNPAALAEIDSSQSAPLVANAGQFLIEQFGPAFQNAIGDRDALNLAEQWILKARQLEPGNSDWNAALAVVYQREAGASLDPHWKAQLLAKAVAVAPNPMRLRLQAALADAEFESGDDHSAERDATELLQSSDPNAAYSAHTVLGRIALDRGDVSGAGSHLLDSARGIAAPFTPRMTLAQDLLDHGERDTVVQFLELCRAFWKNDRGFIDHFVPVIQRGGKPDLLAFYSNVAPQRPPKLPAPEVIAGAEPRWKPVAGAESYVVEWDVQKDGRWLFDTDGTVRVIPTEATSTQIDESRPIRWRVYAVSRTGAGAVTAWQIVHSDAGPVRIYNNLHCR